MRIGKSSASNCVVNHKTPLIVNDDCAFLHGQFILDNVQCAFTQSSKDEFCVAYSLASAFMHKLFIDAANIVGKNAAVIAKSKTSQVKSCVDFVQTMCGGFNVERLGGKFDPLVSLSDDITLCQLRDNVGNNNHCIAIVDDMIFDANNQFALKLSQHALDHCVSIGSKYTYVGIACAYRIRAGKKLKRRRGD